MGLFGLMGLGRKSREPETKREKAWAASKDLSEICRDLESMTVDADCLLGSEAQGTLSPFNAETNALIGEIALLRRRSLLARAKLHAFSFPKIKESLQKLAKEVEEAEAEVAEILAMPDLSLEEEAALKQAHLDKRLVSQALSIGAPCSLASIARGAGVPVDRAVVALGALVAEGLVVADGDEFKRAETALDVADKAVEASDSDEAGEIGDEGDPS